MARYYSGSAAELVYHLSCLYTLSNTLDKIEENSQPQFKLDSAERGAIVNHHVASSSYILRIFTRRADQRLPTGCYGNLIVNVKRGQSRPKRDCGVDPDRHDWATFTFTIIAEVRSCCMEMTKES